MTNRLLEMRIAEVLEMANIGDHFLCCLDHSKECQRYVSRQCNCQMVEITAETTVDVIAAIYRAAMN